ncbi:hypothetical protein [Bradyrhizobium sp. 6(2017)]|uniref:hypothetical protein n=1 Tax=Bradyrhizobium sp. 6(2017) TaxID=1197460 RepID=UPI0013E183CB|nr:hypothetical protein [Bradyrhizobium sp. 6(2017)]QIG96576.1 hypothetical protein G6P99_32020 [Bradyrhizobium sp. 6(2017)]
MGTAVLQLYGDLGVQPFLRSVARTKSLFVVLERDQPVSELLDELDRLESDYEIFKINLFKEFTKYIVINSIVAAALAMILVVIAFKADDLISEAWEPISIAFVFLSLFPAPATLGVLSWDAGRQLKPMKARADQLEVDAGSLAGRL